MLESKDKRFDKIIEFIDSKLIVNKPFFKTLISSNFTLRVCHPNSSIWERSTKQLVEIKYHRMANPNSLKTNN